MDFEAVENIESQIRSILAGHSPDVQGAVLADLTATWIAGFQMIEGNKTALTQFREGLLAHQFNTIRLLIPVAEQQIWKELEDGNQNPAAES